MDKRGHHNRTIQIFRPLVYYPETVTQHKQRGFLPKCIHRTLRQCLLRAQPARRITATQRGVQVANLVLVR